MSACCRAAGRVSGVRCLGRGGAGGDGESSEVRCCGGDGDGSGVRCMMAATGGDTARLGAQPPLLRRSKGVLHSVMLCKYSTHDAFHLTGRAHWRHGNAKRALSHVRQALACKGGVTPSGVPAECMQGPGNSGDEVVA